MWSIFPAKILAIKMACKGQVHTIGKATRKALFSCNTKDVKLRPVKKIISDLLSTYMGLEGNEIADELDKENDCSLNCRKP